MRSKIVTAFCVLLLFLGIMWALFFHSPAEPASDCGKMNDPLSKDLCYWDAAIFGWYSPNSDVQDSHCVWYLGPNADSCHFISNSYLQYMCLRFNMRPHMVEFLSQQSSDSEFKVPNLIEQCEDYDDYSRLFCIYLHAAQLAAEDMNRAKDLCNQLGDKKLIGECEFYSLLPVIMDLTTESSEKIAFTKDFCSGIDHPLWKSECYYVLADELALQTPETHLGEIATACVESTHLAKLGCFNHVALLLELDNAKALCELVDERQPLDEQLPARCFEGVIDQLTQLIRGGQRDNLIPVIENCEEFPERFRDYCMLGLSGPVGRRLAEFLSEEAPFNVSPCYQFPLEFRGNCVYNFGMSIDASPHETTVAIETCSAFQTDIKHECFGGIKVAIARRYADDTASGVEMCNKFPEESRENCLESIRWNLGYLFTEEASLAIEKCYELSEEDKHSCLEHLSKEAIRMHSDLEVGVDLCEVFPNGYKEKCLKDLNETARLRFLELPR